MLSKFSIKIYFYHYRKEEEEKTPEKSWRRLKIRNTMMLLKKSCNHPYLVEYPYIEDTNELKIDEGKYAYFLKQF